MSSATPLEMPERVRAHLKDGSLTLRLQCPPDLIPEQVKKACLDQIAAINRERRRLLGEVLQRSPHDQITGIAAAIVDPLAEHLWGPTHEVVMLAYRLLLLGVIEIPQADWWTPMVIDRLLTHYGEGQKRNICSLTTLINEMLSGAAMRRDKFALWSSLSLPEARVEFRDRMRRMVASIYVSELEFMGRLA